MDTTESCVHRQRFLEVFLSRCSDVPDFNPVPNWLIQLINIDFQQCPSCPEISADSWNPLVMRYLVFVIFSKIVLILSYNPLMHIFADWWTFAHLYFWKTLFFWCWCYWPVALILIRKIFIQFFVFSITYFSSFLLDLSQLVQIAQIYYIKQTHFKHMICFLCFIVNKMWVYEIWKSLYFLFINILQFQQLWKWVCF